jgi:hypothetical protein
MCMGRSWTAVPTRFNFSAAGCASIIVATTLTSSPRRDGDGEPKILRRSTWLVEAFGIDPRVRSLSQHDLDGRIVKHGGEQQVGAGDLWGFGEDLDRMSGASSLGGVGTYRIPKMMAARVTTAR